MTPPLPRPPKELGDTVPEDALIAPIMLDAPATPEDRQKQAERLIKSKVKLRPTPGAFSYLTPEYRRERAQSELDTYHKALQTIIDKDPDSTEASVAAIVKEELDEQFQQQVNNLRSAAERVTSQELGGSNFENASPEVKEALAKTIFTEKRPTSVKKIFAKAPKTSLFVGNEIKDRDIKSVITKTLQDVGVAGTDTPDQEDVALLSAAKKQFKQDLETEIKNLRPTDRSQQNVTASDVPTTERATPVINTGTALGAALDKAVQKEAQSGDKVVFRPHPTNPELNEDGFYKKSEHILRPTSKKDLPRIPDMKAGDTALLQDVDTHEIATWKITSLENGVATLTRNREDGTEETRTYNAGRLKDILKRNAYFENQLPRESKTEDKEKHPPEEVGAEKEKHLKEGDILNLVNKDGTGLIPWTLQKIERKEKKLIATLSSASGKKTQELDLFFLEKLVKRADTFRVQQKDRATAIEKSVRPGNTITTLDNNIARAWTVGEISDKDGEALVSLTNKETGEVINVALSDVVKGIKRMEDWIANPNKGKEKFNNPPIGNLIKTMQPKNIKEQFEAFSAWKKEWVDTGKIDDYRKNVGNTAISDEQIRSTKDLLAAYGQLLELQASDDVFLLSSDARGDLKYPIFLYARILTGKNGPGDNDFSYFVENYNEKQDEALFKKITDMIIKHKPLDLNLSDLSTQVEQIGALDDEAPTGEPQTLGNTIPLKDAPPTEPSTRIGALDDEPGEDVSSLSLQEFESILENNHFRADVLADARIVRGALERLLVHASQENKEGTQTQLASHIAKLAKVKEELKKEKAFYNKYKVFFEKAQESIPRTSIFGKLDIFERSIEGAEHALQTADNIIRDIQKKLKAESEPASVDIPVSEPEPPSPNAASSEKAPEPPQTEEEKLSRISQFVKKMFDSLSVQQKKNMVAAIIFGLGGAAILGLSQKQSNKNNNDAAALENPPVASAPSDQVAKSVPTTLTAAPQLRTPQYFDDLEPGWNGKKYAFRMASNETDWEFFKEFVIGDHGTPLKEDDIKDAYNQIVSRTQTSNGIDRKNALHDSWGNNAVENPTSVVVKIKSTGGQVSLRTKLAQMILGINYAREAVQLPHTKPNPGEYWNDYYIRNQDEIKAKLAADIAQNK